jgi:hypothetical protein
MNMADYKRMVSYMYQYESGVKKKNVGFARIEAKDGQCKITLHMQLLGQLDSIFPTYLIQRKNGSTELIYLGDTFLKNQVMDSKLMADEKNIMSSGYSLSDMGGILLFLNDNVFFATEWDDKPIIAEELLEALRPKQRAEVRTEESREIEGRRSEKAALGIKQTEEKREAREPDRTFRPDQTEEGRAQKQGRFEDKYGSQAVPMIKEGIEEQEEHLSLEEELSIPKYKLPRGYKIIERLQRPEGIDAALATDRNRIDFQSAKAEEAANTNIDIKEVQDLLRLKEAAQQKSEKTIDQFREGAVDQAKEGVVDRAREEAVRQDSEEPDHTQNTADTEKPDPKAVIEIFERYPRIYPFEDNEILLCVKIEPKDIGLLPKDLWTLSNNSFLVHGYYCYHHLIFAKLKDRYGSRFILGVPGIYHNRERFMARMFGFECFKTIRKRELRQGDFGYWYMPVNF